MIAWLRKRIQQGMRRVAAREPTGPSDITCVVRARNSRRARCRARRRECPGAGDPQALVPPRTSGALRMTRRDYYYPNTEALAPDEMRIIALGTGRPFVRRAQANTSWLIELGNGDKFVFDFGSGSQVNFTALEIPHQDITAYFATHLHTDHVGDFAQVWIGSWAGGRVKPLVFYGPSGPEPKYGTEFYVRKQMESFAWDTDTRLGLLPDVGAEVEVHEFDFTRTGMVYERNGVVIKSFPAVHIYDGPVSYRLEWNNLCFVFSGDTPPSQFFVDNAQGADLL